MAKFYDTNPGFGRSRFGDHTFGRLVDFNDEGTRRFGRTTFGKGTFGRNRPVQLTNANQMRRRPR